MDAARSRLSGTCSRVAEDRREALLRYILRPAVAQERVKRGPDGLVRVGAGCPSAHACKCARFTYALASVEGGETDRGHTPAWRHLENALGSPTRDTGEVIRHLARLGLAHGPDAPASTPRGGTHRRPPQRRTRYEAEAAAATSIVSAGLSPRSQRSSKKRSTLSVLPTTATLTPSPRLSNSTAKRRGSPTSAEPPPVPPRIPFATAVQPPPTWRSPFDSTSHSSVMTK